MADILEPIAINFLLESLEGNFLYQLSWWLLWLAIYSAISTAIYISGFETTLLSFFCDDVDIGILSVYFGIYDFKIASMKNYKLKIISHRLVQYISSISKLKECSLFMFLS